MAASGIQHSVADIIRAVPAPNAAAAPKPTRRFDDVLASRRDAPKPDATRKPAADKPHPAAAEPKTKTTGKAKPRLTDDNAAIDDADSTADAAQSKPADETDAVDEMDTPDESDDTADAAADADKPKKAKAGDANRPRSLDDEDVPLDASVDDNDAKPDAPALPDVTAGDDVMLAIDADDGTPAADAKKPADVVELSPDAAAAALAAASPPPATVDTAAPDDSMSEAPVVAPPAAATAKPAAPAPSATASDAAAGAGERVVKPHHENNAAAEAVEDNTAEAAIAASDANAPAEKPQPKVAAAAVDPAALPQPATHEKPVAHAALPTVAQPDVAPQRTVAEDNVDRIVTSVRGELLTKGGSMQIRLDPPSLGAISVQISVDDGVMTASLQTNNDEATRLLSHNLQQLKSSLESTGVTVDRIQVRQAAPAESSPGAQQNHDGDRGQGGGATQDQSARQEQQRREMLQRMWAKLSGSGDPLDLVA